MFKKFLEWLCSLFRPNRPKPVEDLGTFDQYVPYTRNITNEIWSYDPQTLKPQGWASRNTITATSNSSGDVAWLDQNNQGSIEEWATRYDCAFGEPWVWLNAYRDTQTGARYAVSTIKATYQDMTTGEITDITNSCLPQDGQPHGQPYARYRVTKDVYVMRLWMKIWAANGTPDKLVYWEARFEGGVQAHNPCWTGSDSTRLCVNQQECWWEQPPGSIPDRRPPDQGSWIHGGGTSPYDAVGNPIVPTTWYGTSNNFGRDLGACWQITKYDQANHASWWAGIRQSTDNTGVILVA